MKLLLHACCGPCSLEPLRLLRVANHNVTIFYANSNIAPQDEYLKRLDTLRTWADDVQVEVIEAAYEPEKWEMSAGRIGDRALAQARRRLCEADGQTNTPEISDENVAISVDPQLRMARCRICYRLRLEQTAAFAAANGFDGIATTLAVSPYQYVDVIHEELLRAASRANVSTVFQDWQAYYRETSRKSREAGMYHQNWCGCRISALEAAAEREAHKRARRQEREANRQANAAKREAEEEMRAAKRTKQQAYDKKQAHKRAILKALREQQKNEA